MPTLVTSQPTCPKCRAERSDGGEECRRCGIVFAKYRPVAPPPGARSRSNGERSRWLATAKAWLIESDRAVDGVTLIGRALVWAVLVSWGWRFMTTPMESNAVGESFMHLINLPFHEAGHLLFMPFGRFMMFLGGSLGQVLMPLICLGTFLVKTRDPFGASVALWWTAESLMDLAPYIDDARALDLLLLGGVTGKETDGHDWNNILSTLGLLEWDHRLAHLTDQVATVLMLASWVWGGWLLIRQYRRRV